MRGPHRYSHGMCILLPPVPSILTREPPLGNQSRGEMLTLHYGLAKKHIQRIKRIEYPCSHLQWDKSTLPVLQTPSPYPTCLSPGVPHPPREDHCLGFGLVLSFTILPVYMIPKRFTGQCVLHVF